MLKMTCLTLKAWAWPLFWWLVALDSCWVIIFMETEQEGSASTTIHEILQVRSCWWCQYSHGPAPARRLELANFKRYLLFGLPKVIWQLCFPFNLLHGVAFMMSLERSSLLGVGGSWRWGWFLIWVSSLPMWVWVLKSQVGWFWWKYGLAL